MIMRVLYYFSLLVLSSIVLYAYAFPTLDFLHSDELRELYFAYVHQPLLYGLAAGLILIVLYSITIPAFIIIFALLAILIFLKLNEELFEQYMHYLISVFVAFSIFAIYVLIRNKLFYKALFKAYQDFTQSSNLEDYIQTLDKLCLNQVAQRSFIEFNHVNLKLVDYLHFVQIYTLCNHNQFAKAELIRKNLKPRKDRYFQNFQALLSIVMVEIEEEQKAQQGIFVVKQNQARFALFRKHDDLNNDFATKSNQNNELTRILEGLGFQAQETIQSYQKQGQAQKQHKEEILAELRSRYKQEQTSGQVVLDSNGNLVLIPINLRLNFLLGLVYVLLTLVALLAVIQPKILLKLLETYGGTSSAEAILRAYRDWLFLFIVIIGANAVLLISSFGLNKQQRKTNKRLQDSEQELEKAQEKEQNIEQGLEKNYEQSSLIEQVAQTKTNTAKNKPMPKILSGFDFVILKLQIVTAALAIVVCGAIIFKGNVFELFMQAHEDLGDLLNNNTQKAVIFINPKTRYVYLDGPSTYEVRPLIRYAGIGEDTNHNWIEFFAPKDANFLLDRKHPFKESRSIDWNLKNARQYVIHYTPRLKIITDLKLLPFDSEMGLILKQMQQGIRPHAVDVN